MTPLPVAKHEGGFNGAETSDVVVMTVHDVPTDPVRQQPAVFVPISNESGASESWPHSSMSSKSWREGPRQRSSVRRASPRTSPVEKTSLPMWRTVRCAFARQCVHSESKA